MKIRVFDWKANPAVEKASFKLSTSRAEEYVMKGNGYFIEFEGRKAIQKFPPEELRIKHGGYSDAWKMIPSGGIPVWQMVTS